MTDHTMHPTERTAMTMRDDACDEMRGADEPAGHTWMARETGEIPRVAARLDAPDAREALRAAAARFRAADPDLLVTIARGSSDHAMLHLKYAVELRLGLPVASVGPSIASVHGGGVRVARAGVVAASQSGASGDIVALARALAPAAPVALGLVNTVPSPLSDAMGGTTRGTTRGTTGGAMGGAFDLRAGPERAVAATKTCLATMLAATRLVADWAGDDALSTALDAAPERLAEALERDADEIEALLAGERPGGERSGGERSRTDEGPLFVLGRGGTAAAAMEAGLKCMEVLARPALAYSAAEVLHGPATLVGPGTPVLSFGGEGTAEAHGRLVAQGAHLVRLDAIDGGHPLLDGPVRLASFYRAAERAARTRGLDPDAPPHLKKETVTT